MGIVGKRTGSVRFDGRELIALRFQRNRPRRHCVLPGGARHFRQPQRRGKPAAAARGQARRARTRAHLRAVPQPEGTARLQPGHQALRRRAADAGDRPHPAHRRPPAPARRADRGARPGHHPADRQDHPHAESSRGSPFCWWSRTFGSPPPSRTATMSWSTARWSKVSPIRNWTPMSKSSTITLEFEDNMPAPARS